MHPPIDLRLLAAALLCFLTAPIWAQDTPAEPPASPDSPAAAEADPPTPQPEPTPEPEPKPTPDSPTPDSKPEGPVALPVVGYSDTPMLPGQPWRVHDVLRPRPQAIVAGELSTYDAPGTAPSDAIVLLGGSGTLDLRQWAHQGPGGEADLRVPQWTTGDGYVEVLPHSGALRSVDSYGSCQLHVEWAAPQQVSGDSQERGDSGILLMGKYEIQVLDSFENRTFADGQAGAVFGQYPPMVNAARPPGQWQVYDIVFEAPEFDLDGKLLKPAYVTLLHNGVLLHHHRELLGAAAPKAQPSYTPGPPAAPLQLQDNGAPVRYRNVWIRPLR